MQGTGRAYELTVVSSHDGALAFTVNRYDEMTVTIKDGNISIEGTEPDLLGAAIFAKDTLTMLDAVVGELGQGRYKMMAARKLDPLYEMLGDIMRANVDDEFLDVVASALESIKKQIRKNETDLNFEKIVSMMPKGQG